MGNRYYVTPVAERFWKKVNKTEQCWEWTGATRADGYGAFYRGGDGPHAQLAHRVAYEMEVGPIPDDLTIDHLCRNRRCVKVAHLEPVTNRENVLRGVGASASNARKTHCPKGHEYSLENTIIGKRGRICRMCKAALDAKRYQNRTDEQVVAARQYWRDRARAKRSLQRGG